MPLVNLFSMRNWIGFIVLFLSLVACASAQVNPVEGSKVHYRLVRFVFPVDKDAAISSVEVSTGLHSTESKFVREVISRTTTTNGAAVCEVPFWNQNYTWRVRYQVANKERYSKLYHFYTHELASPDSINSRMKIVVGDSIRKGTYVMVDNSAGIYDLKGNLVWYMPEKILPLTGRREVSDFRVTTRGTFTFIDEHAQLMEISYDGDVLGKAPATLPSFAKGLHHEAFRMKNGNYMGLSSEELSWKKEGDRYVSRPGLDTTGGYCPFSCDVVSEFDSSGAIVWQYKVADFVLQSDLMKKRETDGRVRLNVHGNALYFDEKERILYIGLKNANGILKVSYPGGKLLSFLGGKLSKPTKISDDDHFCEQHAIYSQDGALHVFNNRACVSGSLPSVDIYREDASAPDGLAKTWCFVFPLTAALGGKSRGGNIRPMNDGTIFTSASSPYGDMMIVDKNKKVLWHAVLEQRSAETGIWAAVPTYRASFFTLSDLLFQ